MTDKEIKEMVEQEIKLIQELTDIEDPAIYRKGRTKMLKDKHKTSNDVEETYDKISKKHRKSLDKLSD